MHGFANDILEFGMMNQFGCFLQCKVDVPHLIIARAWEGSSVEGVDNVSLFPGGFQQESFVLGQCVCNGGL